MKTIVIVVVLLVVATFLMVEVSSQNDYYSSCTALIDRTCTYDGGTQNCIPARKEIRPCREICRYWGLFTGWRYRGRCGDDMYVMVNTRLCYFTVNCGNACLALYIVSQCRRS